MQMLDLAFLAPSIVRQIVAGEQPVALTTKWLLTDPLPPNLQEQSRIINAL